MYFKIVKRGAAPNGGGEVIFSCPVRRTLRPLQFTEPGKIKRIRGLAYPLVKSGNLGIFAGNNALRDALFIKFSQ